MWQSHQEWHLQVTRQGAQTSRNERFPVVVCGRVRSSVGQLDEGQKLSPITERHFTVHIRPTVGGAVNTLQYVFALRTTSRSPHFLIPEHRLKLISNSVPWSELIVSGKPKTKKHVRLSVRR